MKWILNTALVLGFTYSSHSFATPCAEYTQFESVNAKLEQAEQKFKLSKLVSSVDISTLKVSCADSLETFTAKMGQSAALAASLAETSTNIANSQERENMRDVSQVLNSAAGEMLAIGTQATTYK